MLKNRLPYLFAFLITVVVGLGSRSSIIPTWIYPYLGDALYATMFYFIISIVSPNASWLKKLVWAIVCCWSIELFQLYQAPWINDFRKTWVGRLTLGSGFLWSDMAAYVVGACLGLWLDKKIIRRKRALQHV